MPIFCLKLSFPRDGCFQWNVTGNLFPFFYCSFDHATVLCAGSLHLAPPRGTDTTPETTEGREEQRLPCRAVERTRKSGTHWRWQAAASGVEAPEPHRRIGHSPLACWSAAVLVRSCNPARQAAAPLYEYERTNRRTTIPPHANDAPSHPSLVAVQIAFALPTWPQPPAACSLLCVLLLLCGIGNDGCLASA